MAKRNGIKPICFFMATIMCVILLIVGLTSCEAVEKRENYTEENGWMALIRDEDSKTAKLIGNKKESIVKGEAVLPSSIKGYQIEYINAPYKGYSFNVSYFDFIPDKLFVPGVNYRFSREISFPKANKKIIFLGIDTKNYSNGFNLANDFGTHYPYARKAKFYVAGKYIYDFKQKYDAYTTGSFYSANVSYYYNYEDAPNGGYCWIDDLDEGEKIKTIPQEPEREGYVFGGWYLEKQCLTKFDFDTYTMDGSGELELFAKWIKK